MGKRAQLAAFAAAVLLQALIVAGVPMRKVTALATGRTVVLKVAPVDPYNILSGYYVVLGYEIGRPAAFPGQPLLADGDVVWAVVEERDGLWRPVSLEREKPRPLPANRAALRGIMGGTGSIEYGIEEFYIPEERRGAIEDDLRRNAGEARVEVKAGAWGNALLRLRIQDRIYE